MPSLLAWVLGSAGQLWQPILFDIQIYMAISSVAGVFIAYYAIKYIASLIRHKKGSQTKLTAFFLQRADQWRDVWITTSLPIGPKSLDFPKLMCLA